MDTEKTMQYILEQQAKFWAGMEEMRARQEEMRAQQAALHQRQAATDDRLDRVPIIVQELIEIQKRAEQRMDALAQAQQRADERMDALIAVVNGLVAGQIAGGLRTAYLAANLLPGWQYAGNDQEKQIPKDLRGSAAR